MNPRTQAEILYSRVRVPDNVVFRRFGAETIALDLQTTESHVLDLEAGEILEGLLAAGRVRRAVERIAATSQRRYHEVAGEVCELCKTLESRGLILIER